MVCMYQRLRCTAFTVATTASCLGLFAMLAEGQEPGGSGTPTPFEVEDLFRFANVGSPRLSPDASQIVYTVSRTDYKEKKSSAQIWISDVDGSNARALTARGSSASNPQWSPDGRSITFSGSRNDSKTQVWSLDLRGGEAQSITDVKNGISSYTWSPDGSKLLLSIRDDKEEDGEDDEEAGNDSADATDDDSGDPMEPWVINRLGFKRDGVGYLTDQRQTHYYVYTIATKDLIQITSGNASDSQGRWSPDGKRVAFVSNRSENPDSNFNTDIWVVSASNSDKGGSMVQVTTNPGSDASPAWSPDGQSIAHTTGVEPDLIWYATTHLAVASSTGGQSRLLTQSLDRNVGTPTYSADGRWIYFRLEDSSERHLARIKSDGTDFERTIEGPLSLRGFDLAADGTIAALISTPTLPAEVHVLRGGVLKRISRANDDFLKTRRIATVINATFPSKDGQIVEGLFYLPPGHEDGIQHPTLLRIHGGPVAMYDHSFNIEAQIFASQGYVVVTTNPRGSSGYGQDFSYALWADWGNKDFEDVMAGVDYAVAQGWSDEDRLGVGGWSYGGILTNYVITKTDRFKGAITGASEVLYRSNYGHDHYQRQWEAELGLPWVTPEAWERISPFNDVANVTTPTLIMGGEKDWNVPIINSEQLYQALRRLGQTTQLVVYPGEGHGLRHLPFRKDRMERYLEWYGKYVKNRGQTPVS